MPLTTGWSRKTSAGKRPVNRSWKEGSQGVPSHPRGDGRGKSRGWERSAGSPNSKETGGDTSERMRPRWREGKDGPR